MSIPAAFLDELRARVALTTVVGQRVKLARAGRESKGCCPFHNEKSPSFFVNDDKGFYHCFGCGAHGDVIRFVVEQEGLGFIDAVKSLAAEAGLAMPEETAESRERSQAAASLHDVTAAAAAWFAEQLQSIAGTAARRYLDQRGIGATAVRDFGLGLAPDARTRLKAALGSHGEARLVETGLLIRPEADDATGGKTGSAGETYDRFRGRLMFPIRDPRGRVIGFGGRILGDGQPKYLNSPDTPLFDKGRTLYNLDRAGPVARKSQRLVVVEGYMDVIALAQAGIAEAVAPLGTALTEAQLALLWKVVPEPILCFDGDAAGQRAATRAALRALPVLEPGRSLRFATLPPGKDPDDLVRERGAGAFEALLAAAEPLIDRLWRSETESVDMSTPERRAAVPPALEALAAKIEHRDLQGFYRREFRQRFHGLFRRPERAPWPRSGGDRRISPGVLRSAPPDIADAVLRPVLTAILLRPALIDKAFESLARLKIADGRHADLLSAILSATCDEADLSADALRDRLGASSVLAEQLLARHQPGISPCAFLVPSTPIDVASEQLAELVGAMA